jgi:site-specific DNA recombinase
MTKLLNYNDTNTNRPVVIYARISSVKAQERGPGGHQSHADARKHAEQHDRSLAAQMDAGRRFAEMHNYEVIGEFKEVQSGRKAANRQKFQKALALCRKHKAILHVWSLSRAFRSTRDAIEISESLAKAGCDLVSSTEAIQTNTPMGRTFFVIMSSIAQLEAELAGERITSSLNLKRARGERLGGKVPYGYKVAANGTNLVEVKSETKIIDLMIKERNKGVSYAGIADVLNAKGIPTKEGKTWRGRTVNFILKRQVKQVEAMAA